MVDFDGEDDYVQLQVNSLKGLSSHLMPQNKNPSTRKKRWSDHCGRSVTSPVFAVPHLSI
jgi:hypothetical protein